MSYMKGSVYKNDVDHGKTNEGQIVYLYNQIQTSCLFCILNPGAEHGRA